MATNPEQSKVEAPEDYQENYQDLSHQAESNDELREDLVPENLTGLVDPEKPTSDMDVVRQQDLIMARNLRRLEIHRYEISNALSSMDQLDIGIVEDDDEDAIELSESEEKHAIHVAKVNEERRQRQRKRLAPHSGNELSKDKFSKAAALLSHLLPGDNSQNNLSFMRHNLCLTWHGWRYDREIEARLFSPSQRFRPLSRNRTLREREQQAPCAPTRLVSWSLDCIASYQEGGSFRHFTFIDPEAGHGRTLLMASHHDFRSIIGVENRGKLAEDAAMNIAQYPRTFMARREVHLITRDIRLIEWPEQPLIVQIFAPQSAEWLSQIMEALSASFAAQPRQIYLVMIGNRYPEVLGDYEYIHGFTPPSSHLEKMTLASPFEVDFYYFTANAADAETPETSETATEYTAD
ncbi:MAG: hypothetical protein DHS20C08_22410 [Rhodomicrobium sp.]|nr:MAG: hypothetical protein DHS20C08_22410 [Rhodomicrobium sp.]